MHLEVSGWTAVHADFLCNLSSCSLTICTYIAGVYPRFVITNPLDGELSAQLNPHLQALPVEVGTLHEHLLCSGFLLQKKVNTG